MVSLIFMIEDFVKVSACQLCIMKVFGYMTAPFEAGDLVSTNLAVLQQAIPTRFDVNTKIYETIFGHDHPFIIEAVRPVVVLFVVEER